jgi:hypothetical protein
MLRVAVHVIFAALLMISLPYFIMWGIWPRTLMMLSAVVLAIIVDLINLNEKTKTVAQVYVLFVFGLSMLMLVRLAYSYFDS